MAERPWAARERELAESEGVWAGLGAWLEWANANWYIPDEHRPETEDDTGYYLLCCKLHDAAQEEIEQLQSELAAAKAQVIEPRMKLYAEIERLRALAEYLDDPAVLLKIPQPLRLRISELLDTTRKKESDANDGTRQV